MKSFALVGIAALLASAGSACAQFSTLEWPVGQDVAYRYDSGIVDNALPKAALGVSVPVEIRNARWIRVHFDEVVLGEGSHLRITSVLDGEVQVLDAEALEMWSHGSAYFNGDTVVVDLIAGPNTRNVVSIKKVAAEIGLAPAGNPGDCGICGADDRFQTNELWSARIMPVGCTASLYCQGSGFVTAGHCLSGGSAQVIHFNVPNSSSTCATNVPPVDDQFPVLAGAQFLNAGVGSDWGTFVVGVNGAGQTPFARYGTFRPLASGPSAAGAATNIWGYGVDRTCARSQTQQNSFGTINAVNGSWYDMNNDVRGGNSGSGFLNSAGQIIGVVSHCAFNGCNNVSNRIDDAAFTAARTAVGCGVTAVPRNNDCTAATAISLGSINGTTLGATTDGTSSCGATGSSPDVWYSFTPTCGGVYRFETCGGQTNYDSVLSVHTGCPGSSTNTLACSDDACDLQSRVDVSMLAGQRYLIRVGGFSTRSGNFTLTASVVTPDPAPVNDLCANAISMGLGSIAGTTYCASTDGASSCGFSATNDVWYRFTPECSGTYTFDTCAEATFDTVVSVHTACSIDATTQIACNDDACNGLRSRVNASLTAGSTYLVRVAGYFNAQGNFTLTATRGADTLATNDACANAIAVGVGTVDGSTFCATVDGTATCGASEESNDVWYAFTPDCDGFYSAATVGTTNFDTVLSVHDGCPGNAFNQFVCDDDGGEGLLSRAVFSGTAGRPVLIRVSGFFGRRGSFQLAISNVPNDSSDRGIWVEDGSWPFSNRGATLDGLPDGLCRDVADDQQVQSDVWFYYTPSCDGRVAVDTCGPGYDSKLAVYPWAGAFPPVGPVGCNDDSSCNFSSLRSRVEFDAIPGQVYLIRVGGYRGSQGCGVLNIACTPADQCPSCPADFNLDGGIDGGDIDAFFVAWEASEPCGDVNFDGGVDFADIEVFFTTWENGGC
jgi:hypothetical protein